MHVAQKSGIMEQLPHDSARMVSAYSIAPKNCPQLGRRRYLLDILSVKFPVTKSEDDGEFIRR
jgi:hypothetical protein